MVLSAVAAGVSAQTAAASASSHANASTAASTSSAATTSAASASSANDVYASATSSPAVATTPSGAGPHPGTLEVYEPVPGGATTLDPATAYDTTSYEVILNVYQTLISYNGSSTSTFVPTLATCVPGQGGQCASDYGSGFTGIFNATGANFTGSNGEPVYWTYVIDPAAHFYDPSTGKNWSVYPSDVMFSIARTLAFSTVPYATKTAGWIMAQALLPPGNASWDNGTHAPFNNTPSHVLGSMLVNSSAYCPKKAMNGIDGNGCITFVANGSNQVWPEFNEFVADNLGASIVPCGWFTYEDAGVPGWAGTAASSGDGSCKLPDGGTTTSASGWSTYLSSLKPTAWDDFELLDINWPAPQPNVQWKLVGSGPYYASVTQGLSYALAENPAYEQPSGCNATSGLAIYTGYCDPAPGAFIANVDVIWETSEQGDSLGTSAILAGTADFAGIYTTQTSTLLGFVKSGIWQYNLFSTLSTAFTPINLGISYSAYNTTFAGTPLKANPIPPLAFTDLALRDFYIAAYPYTTIENTINTVDGIQFAFNAGGPIPQGMGNYYPSNVSWPYLLGDPTQGASVVGSAAWWWSQITTPSSAYYNATVATKCTTSSPCTWPIGYFDGAPANLVLINDWAGEIWNLSGHRLQAWALPESFTQFLTTLVGPYESPLASEVGFGWAPDYPDPTDYMAPMAAPNGDYTGPDTFSNQLFLSQYEDNASCGHYGDTFANLSYWAAESVNASTSTMTSKCQGVAYQVASYWMSVAGAAPEGASRTLWYNMIEHITNALGMYVYNGQSNELVGFAPWIDPKSINENPMIGGGGDSVWYQVRYLTSVYSVTVSESGLPVGTKWSATLGPDTFNSTTASIVFPGEPNGTYNYSVGFQAGYGVSPSNGTVKIDGANITQDVTYAAFTNLTSAVTFNETGLVSNTTWSIVVSGYGSLQGSTPGLSYPLPQDGKYAYQAQYVLGYATPAGSTVDLATSAVSVTVPYVGVVAPTYAVTFIESGLTVGANWSVSIGPVGSQYTLSSTTDSITFYETNGSYAAAFTLPTGYDAAANPALAVVVGTALNVSVPCALAKNLFAVTFTETGLTAGHSWSLTIANLTQTSTTSKIVFKMPNGTLSWAITPIPSWIATNATGSVTVAGAALGQTIAFRLYTYQVTFFEGGLATGAKWSITVGNASGNVTIDSTTYFLVANLSNGTFNWSVGAIAGYTATPSNGSFTVNNTSATVVVIFGPIPETFAVTFSETGLPTGASWTVYFNGQTKSAAAGATIAFTVVNGTWTYAATATEGYVGTPSGGSAVVTGAPTPVSVVFTKTSSSTSTSATSLSELAYGLIGLFALLAVIGFALAARNAGRKPPANPPETWSGEPSASGGTSTEGAGSGTPPPPSS